MSRLGRNDPCPCGSGRKYKHCCLNKPNPTARLQLVLRHAAEAREPLHAFAAEPRFQALMTAAWFRFTEARGLNDGPESEAERTRFLDWFQLLYHLPSGETLLESFLREHGRRLLPRHRAILEGWRRCSPGVYQVLDVLPTGARLGDIFRGGEIDVLSATLQEQIVRWDLIIGNVIETEEAATLSGAVITLGPHALDPLRKFAQGELRRYRRKARGAGWDQFLRDRFDRLNEFVDRQRPPSLVTPEGDAISFATARYDVTDPQTLAPAIRTLPDIEAYDPDPEEPTVRAYDWSETVDVEPPRPFSTPPLPGFEGHPRRSLGFIEWRGDHLSLQCLSEERLRRGKALLAELGECVRHRADSLQSVEQSLAERGDVKRPERTIPPELEAGIVGKYYEHHYASWPDEPLPALDGKTPRQAIRTTQGRAIVENLLREFENGAERLRREGRPAYDFSKLRVALGLTGWGTSSAAASRLVEASPGPQASGPRAEPEDRKAGAQTVAATAPAPPASGPGLWVGAPPEREADIRAATDAAWAFTDALNAYDESLIGPLFVPGRLPDVLLNTFGLDALIAVSGWADEARPEVRVARLLIVEAGTIAIELEHFEEEGSAPPFPLTLTMQRYRSRWRVERLLPAHAGEPLDLAILPFHLTELLLGLVTLDPLPAAVRDPVEDILLRTLPQTSANLLEQGTALRIWRDFVRRYTRGAGMAPGHEHAWAAAVEYTVRVLESMEGSQKAVGEIYGLSAGTLARYAKQVETVLGLEHHDPRYAIAPDEGERSMAAVMRSITGRRRLRFGAGRGSRGYFR